MYPTKDYLQFTTLIKVHTKPTTPQPLALAGVPVRCTSLSRSFDAYDPGSTPDGAKAMDHDIELFTEALELLERLGGD